MEDRKRPRKTLVNNKKIPASATATTATSGRYGGSFLNDWFPGLFPYTYKFVVEIERLDSSEDWLTVYYVTRRVDGNTTTKDVRRVVPRVMPDGNDSTMRVNDRWWIEIPDRVANETQCLSFVFWGHPVPYQIEYEIPLQREKNNYIRILHRSNQPAYKKYFEFHQIPDAIQKKLAQNQPVANVIATKLLDGRDDDGFVESVTNVKTPLIAGEAINRVWELVPPMELTKTKATTNTNADRATAGQAHSESTASFSPAKYAGSSGPVPTFRIVPNLFLEPKRAERSKSKPVSVRQRGNPAIPSKSGGASYNSQSHKTDMERQWLPKRAGRSVMKNQTSGGCGCSLPFSGQDEERIRFERRKEEEI